MCMVSNMAAHIQRGSRLEPSGIHCGAIQDQTATAYTHMLPHASITLYHPLLQQGRCEYADGQTATRVTESSSLYTVMKLLLLLTVKQRLGL